MVNNLSTLALFLEDESFPLWLKKELQARREEISRAFEMGEAVTLQGPAGETVRIAPKTLASAVA